MEDSERYSSSYCQDDGSTIRQRIDFISPPPISNGADTNNTSDDHSLSWKYLPRNVSNTSILTSIICIVAGSGTLGIPYALSQSGWIGMLFLLMSAVISHYTGCLIIRCLYLGQHKRLDGFPEIGYATFGRTGQVIGFIFSQLLLFATPIVYFILASSNIADLLLSAGIRLDFKVCAWMVSVAVGIPFIMVRNMRDVSFMSLLATLASISLVLIISVVSTADFHIEERDNNQVHHNIAIPRQFPMAFSTFSFSYCGNVIYPQLEGCMSQPQHWSKVMMVATTVITLMYVIIGFVCYLVYGNQVLNPVFLNIPHGAARNVAMIVTTIHVLLASPLYLYVFTIRIESWLGLPYYNQITPTDTSDRPCYAHRKNSDSLVTITKGSYYCTPSPPPLLHNPHHHGDSIAPILDDANVNSNTDSPTEKGCATTAVVTDMVDTSTENKISENSSNSVYLYFVQRSVRFLEWLCNHPVLARVLLRSLEIAVCSLIAMLVPYFSDVMNLIGTVAAESLTFVLPCVFFIRLAWKEQSSNSHLQRDDRRFSLILESIVCASVAIFGVFCISFGIVDAIVSLTKDLSK